MLTIKPDTVCYLIIKAREFDAKVEPVEPEPASNPADDGACAILEDYSDDPTLQELRAALAALNQDERLDLMTLVWIGRGDFDTDQWAEAREEAENALDPSFLNYLTGIPLLGDYLEDGLTRLGYDCHDMEMAHL